MQKCHCPRRPLSVAGRRGKGAGRGPRPGALRGEAHSPAAQGPGTHSWVWLSGLRGGHRRSLCRLEARASGSTVPVGTHWARCQEQDPASLKDVSITHTSGQKRTYVSQGAIPQFPQLPGAEQKKGAGTGSRVPAGQCGPSNRGLVDGHAAQGACSEHSVPPPQPLLPRAMAGSSRTQSPPWATALPSLGPHVGPSTGTCLLWRGAGSCSGHAVLCPDLHRRAAGGRGQTPRPWALTSNPSRPRPPALRPPPDSAAVDTETSLRKVLCRAPPQPLQPPGPAGLSSFPSTPFSQAQECHWIKIPTDGDHQARTVCGL